MTDTGKALPNVKLLDKKKWNLFMQSPHTSQKSLNGWNDWATPVMMVLQNFVLVNYTVPSISALQKPRTQCDCLRSLTTTLQ